jgi:hypothetical protein
MMMIIIIIIIDKFLLYHPPCHYELYKSDKNSNRSSVSIHVSQGIAHFAEWRGAQC